MNNFEYENQLGTVHLVYRIQPQEEVDTFVLGMLCNNEIQGIAKTIFTQIDSEKFVKYNVSSKVPVSRFFDGPVSKKSLIGVFSGIVDAMLSADDYMIDQRALLLDLDYIFTDVSTYDTVMICLPLVRDAGESVPDMNAFFKNIIFSTKFDQTENCDHVAKILNYLNSNPVVSLNDFKELLESIVKADQPKKAAQPKPQVVTQPVTRAQPAVQQPVVSQPPVQSVQQPKPQVESKYADLRSGSNYPQGTDKGAGAKKPEVVQPTKDAAKPDEKPITMFYLLQHYNKDNAAKYKAQQEAKKAKKAAGDTKKTQKGEKSSASKKASASFAIPGQQSDQGNPGFAIPGQTTPAVSQPVQPVAKVEQQVVAPAAPSADKCPNCGATMGAGQAFCTSCGTRRTGTPASQPVVTPVVQSGKPINFGETTVLGGQIGETTVLGAVANPTKADPHLIRSKNNEKIPLNKPVFRIGKERSYVDYFVGDNTAISRSHANIVNHNGEFFVVDTNSTNHTYVNGGMIQSNVETKLSHGTKIRLANEDFEFRLY